MHDIALSLRDDVVTAIRLLQSEIAGLGATELSIFGSRARGDNREDSDLDVVVDYADEAPLSLVRLLKIKHLIEDATGLEVHITTRRSFPPAKLQAIERDFVRVL